MVKINGKDLINRGVKPNRISLLLKQINSASSEEEIEFAINQTLEEQNKIKEKITTSENSVLNFFLNKGRIYVPRFLEARQSEPSNSEIRRALENKAVLLNGKRASPFDEIDFPIWQLVWFPNSNKKCTICDDRTD